MLPMTSESPIPNKALPQLLEEIEPFRHWRQQELLSVSKSKGKHTTRIVIPRNTTTKQHKE